MKVLSVCGVFELPDDFNGSRTEALESFVRYRSSKGYSGNTTGKIVDPVDDTQGLWELFLNVIETSELKWVSGITVAKSDIDGNWEVNTLEPIAN